MKMNKPDTKSCPECNSSNTKSAATKSFQFASNRKCLDCGVVWRPTCPTWGAVISIVLGLAICVAGIGLLGNGAMVAVRNGWSPTDVLFSLILLAVIVFAFRKMMLFGWRTLKGTAGQLTILEEPRSEKASS